MYVAHGAGTLLLFGQVITKFLLQGILLTCVAVISYNKAARDGVTAAKNVTHVTNVNSVANVTNVTNIANVTSAFNVTYVTNFTYVTGASVALVALHSFCFQSPKSFNVRSELLRRQ